MKYFYTDPLEAAYMAKHYGMNCNFEDHKFRGWNTEHQLPLERYYVHPDSLKILEPKEGDIAWWLMPGGGRCLGQATPILIAQGGLYSIIERDSRPFFWPEIES